MHHEPKAEVNVGRLRMVLVYGTAAVVLALDQLTKWAVVENLRGEPPVDVIGSFVQLTYTTNTGGAFSILNGFPMFFGLMALVIIVALAIWARRLTHRPTLLVLGMLLGGAVGNFIDRLLRGDELLRGGVVDFVDIGSFPVFNVADSCITVGAILLAILITWEDITARRTAEATDGDTSDHHDHGSDRSPAPEPGTTDAQPPVASEADPDPQR